MRLFSDQRALLLDQYQASGVKIGPSRATEAVGQAYRQIGSCLPWSYLHRRTQINTVAPYTTGTIAYTSSSRTVTLTGGTFPSWAGTGLMLISGNVYGVQQRVSNTSVILMSDRCPQGDVAALTVYVLMQPEYLLPANYVRTEELVEINQWWALAQRPSGSMLETSRLWSRPSRPFEYTVRGSQYSVGRMAIEFSPPPDAAYTFDVTYYAQPRPRTLTAEYSTGTVSVSGTAVTGVGTAFTQAMVGCRLRQGTESAAPSGEYGPQGSLNENTILSVTDATHLVLADAGTTSSGVQFVIDDPIDIERGAMDEVFCRMCEFQFESLSHSDKRQFKEQEMNRALARARAMDVRPSPRAGTTPPPTVEALVYANLGNR